MYKAFHEYVPRMATPEMTAELEEDMDQIAAGKTSKDEVLRISREMLHSHHRPSSRRSSEDLAKQIWAGMDEDKFLGPCKVCEEAGRKHEDGSPNRLRIIELKGGKRMYGCEGWIPRRPRVDPTPARSAARCRAAATSSGGSRSAARSASEMPRLTVKGFRGRPWKLCLNDDCPSMVEMREKRAEREAARRAQRPRRRRRTAAADGDSTGRRRGRRPRAATARRRAPQEAVARRRRAPSAPAPAAK